MIQAFVIGSRESDFTRGKVTVTGQQLYPVGYAIPAIVKNSGCVGLCDITSITITEDSTTINFKLIKISSDERKAYYRLYQTNSGASNTYDSDYLSNTDQIIPGMMGLSNSKAPDKPAKKSKKASSFCEALGLDDF